jgi:hypothetical protein
VLILAGLVFGLAAGVALEARDTRAVSARLVAGSSFNIGSGVVSAVVVGFVGGIHIGTRFGIVPGLIFGSGAGLAAGVATGIVSGSGGRTRAGRRLRPGIGAVLGAALVDGLPAGLASGVPLGLVIGLSTGLASGLPAGLGNGLGTGLVFIVAFALIDGLWSRSVGRITAANPISAWRQDLQRSALVGLAFGLALGFYAGLDSGITTGRQHPLGTAITVGTLTFVAVWASSVVPATVMASRTWQTALLFAQLWVRGTAPLRGMTFLEDAHRRGIMRVVGPVYQFRHARLQDRLARAPE